MPRCPILTFRIALYLLLIAGAPCCSPQNKDLCKLQSPQYAQVNTILHSGWGNLSYREYQKWYLTKYLIELKGDEWYRDNVIKPMMCNRSRLQGIVRLNRDGQFNIIRNVGLDDTLDELCEYLTHNHKLLVLDYTSAPPIDFLPERTNRPDTLDCNSLRKLIRRENALIFIFNHNREEVTHPIPFLRLASLSSHYPDIDDADEILRLVKEEIVQCVDSFEAEALRQNVCPNLTNEDLLGIPTREEVIDAKNWYFQNRAPNSYFDSMETEALRYIDEYNKTKQPRATR